MRFVIAAFPLGVGVIYMAYQKDGSAYIAAAFLIAIMGE